MRRHLSGQVAVETAIVMPLFVFLMLGMLQLGLMHQARLMAKYAAYKAARTGAIHSGEMKTMENAALAVMLPMVGRKAGGADSFYKTDSASEFNKSWQKAQNNEQEDGLKLVEVTICGPTKQDITFETDFDDPDVIGNVGGWKQFDKMRLHVQVTAYYRLVIPFANGVIWYIARGNENKELLRVLRLGNKPKTPKGGRTIDTRLGGLADQHIYIMPIRESYGLRMHSNFSEDLPGHNECKIPWAKAE